MLLTFLLAFVLGAPHSLPRQAPHESTALESHEAMDRPFQSGGPEAVFTSGPSAASIDGPLTTSTGSPSTASASEPPSASIGSHSSSPISPAPQADSRTAFAQLATDKSFLDTDREPSDFLPEILAEVPRNSDVVLLLDQTASMGDDIERIREEFEALRRALEAQPGVRFGAVTFSDLKKKGGYGYRAFPLSRDFDGVDGFLKEVMLIGSVEDVHEALIRTLQTFKWRPGAPRLLIVISDEGPALPPDSDYTAADVLAKARASNPPAQIQPIRITRD